MGHSIVSSVVQRSLLCKMLRDELRAEAVLFFKATFLKLSHSLPIPMLNLAHFNTVANALFCSENVFLHCFIIHVLSGSLENAVHRIFDSCYEVSVTMFS